MLDEFITAQSPAILSYARARREGRGRAVDVEAAPDPSGFLRDVAVAVRVARLGLPAESSALKESARLHGADLLRRRRAVDQAVYEYGDLSKAIRDLAVESASPIS